MRAAIEGELFTLREIDANYAKMRDVLNDWTGSQAEKDELLQKIEERHRRDREPHVLRLAELHDWMISSAKFRAMRTGLLA